MSAFEGDLDIRIIGDRQYETRSQLLYHSDLAKCTIVIPTGTITDGLSTWGVPIISNILDGTNAKPGVLHDYLYSCHMFTRAMSDAILREACIAVGTSSWKAWIIWTGVRIGGGFHW